jgi:hypothetical protein
MATIQQRISLVGAEDVKKAIADIVSAGGDNFKQLQESIEKTDLSKFKLELTSSSSSVENLLGVIREFRTAIAGGLIKASASFQILLATVWGCSRL